MAQLVILPTDDLSSRDASGWIATPDHDDGLMVVRFGPSFELDLTASLSCEMRAGDAW